jgi:hypothetical protein
MKHGNGYCRLHGDRRKCTYPQLSNQQVCVYSMALKRNNAARMDAPTMLSGMGFASIMVLSAIAL